MLSQKYHSLCSTYLTKRKISWSFFFIFIFPIFAYDTSICLTQDLNKIRAIHKEVDFKIFKSHSHLLVWWNMPLFVLPNASSKDGYSRKVTFCVTIMLSCPISESDLITCAMQVFPRCHSYCDASIHLQDKSILVFCSIWGKRTFR